MRRRGPCGGAARGFNLVELLVVAAVVALTVLVGAPRLLDLSKGMRLRLAAGELVGVLRSARSLAVRHNVDVGVKFRTGDDGTVSFTLYRDGDGDGVRTRDIDAGVDPQLQPLRTLEHMGVDVRFGFPPGPPPRDPDNPRRRLKRLGDPIRFNRSDLASFNPLGGSTPGSLYLTDSRGQLLAVRLFGRTGKVRVIAYDAETEVWSSR